jgi:hypothetical protein
LTPAAAGPKREKCLGHPEELSTDRIALAKATYEREGPGRTNLRYGYVTPPIA